MSSTPTTFSNFSSLAKDNSEARAAVLSDRAKQTFYVWTSDSPQTLLGIPDTVVKTLPDLARYLLDPTNLAVVTENIKSNPQLSQAQIIAVDATPGAGMAIAYYQCLAIQTLIEQITADRDICPGLEEVLSLSSGPDGDLQLLDWDPTREKLMELRRSRPGISVPPHSSMWWAV